MPNKINHNTGIYKITNTANGKCYVGSANHMGARLNVHKSNLRLNRHCSQRLQRSFNKHGVESFKFEKLLCCSKEDLLFYEQRAIDYFRSIKMSYNLRDIAERNPGWKHTEEAKRKMSAFHKGKIRSDEHKAKLSESMKKSFTEEHRQILSRVNKGNKYCEGKTPSEETRRKLSETNKGRLPWNTGKTGAYSEEYLARKSEAFKGNKLRLGIPHTEETKRKMSLASKRLKLTESAKKKISEANMGNVPWNKGRTDVFSDEALQKMSEAAQKRMRGPDGRYHN